MLARLLKIIFAGVLYYFAVYHYLPSDITYGLWILQPTIIAGIAGITLLFIAAHLIKHFRARRKRSAPVRALILLLCIPSYLFISLLILVVANGALDTHTRRETWETNLVYLKNVKVMCIIAGIDDRQLTAGQQSADIAIVPGIVCPKVKEDVHIQGLKHPYTLEISAGRLNIPYIIDILPQQL